MCIWVFQLLSYLCSLNQSSTVACIISMQLSKQTPVCMRCTEFKRLNRQSNRTCDLRKLTQFRFISRSLLNVTYPSPADVKIKQISAETFRCFHLQPCRIWTIISDNWYWKHSYAAELLWHPEAGFLHRSTPATVSSTPALMFPSEQENVFWVQHSKVITK